MVTGERQRIVDNRLQPGVPRATLSGAAITAIAPRVDAALVKRSGGEAVDDHSLLRAATLRGIDHIGPRESDAIAFSDAKRLDTPASGTTKTAGAVKAWQRC